MNKEAIINSFCAIETSYKSFAKELISLNIKIEYNYLKDIFNSIENGCELAKTILEINPELSYGEEITEAYLENIRIELKLIRRLVKSLDNEIQRKALIHACNEIEDGVRYGSTIYYSAA